MWSHSKTRRACIGILRGLWPRYHFSACLVRSKGVVTRCYSLNSSAKLHAPVFATNEVSPRILEFTKPLIYARALYPRGDPYESSDPVFGVKESLIVDLSEVSDAGMAKKYSVKEETPLLTYDFVLISEEETRKLRKEKVLEAIKKMGKSMDDFKSLPIFDVD